MEYLNLIEIQLFPSISYFKILENYKNIEIESCESYKKNSFRNRYIISGANGLINLTVPIAGGREQKTLIKDVQIDYSENWQLKHWRAIVSSYNKSPYFEYYRYDLENLIFTKESHLFNYDLIILKWCLKVLKLELEMSFTQDYISICENVDDHRNSLLPKNYDQGFENWEPKYAQVFEERFGFLPNLSILDLLFAEGPNARNLLAKSVK